MDYLTQHPWRKYIKASIDSDLNADISENNSKWEYLDGEMVKVGSLEHEQLNIPELQKAALELLSLESKDLRILAHLLRTLQHSGKVLELLLGFQLLWDYVELYWNKAAPASDMKKYRIGMQILKRFSNHSRTFSQIASRLEKETANTLLTNLSIYWKGSKLESEIIELHRLYTLPVENVVDIPSKNSSNTENVAADLASHQKVETLINIPVAEPIDVDSSNERAWKNTLFKVVEHLLEKDIGSPIGYQLRRYAMWNAITAVPMAEEGKTPLAPPAADRIAEYESAVENPTIDLWREVEYSITLAPYWFDGHYLSALIAKRLGYHQAAETIRSNLNDFLLRLPPLKILCFSDGSPFCSERVLKWLNFDANASNLHNHRDHYAEEFNELSFEAAIAKMNEADHTDLRNHFYDQIALAKLFEKQGLINLAKQHYFSVYKAIEQIPIKEWEHSLYTLLKNKLEINK
ncbi:type VI secretion system protein TssA [Conservatibacter flavescens]|uniref:Type VI secretion system protein TssA n=1 Tax=Conservatibacter flavescens TaxID=28161 RepID=A0A2M8S2P6_9PAST|nr:type VI secretion system protein TssA [Conservatibacter flavescens]PJG85419.1 type VI secretion system protein TssA [Conservatibacter flavescens]